MADGSELVNDGRLVCLVSQEGTVFEVPVNVANMSSLAAKQIERDHEGEPQEIFLPDVKSLILGKVIEFCNHYSEEKLAEIAKPLKSTNFADSVTQPWYVEFVTCDKPYEQLLELMLAADYMDILPLLDLTCAAVACLVKEKDVEQIKSTFEVDIEFEPESEEKVREENKWCEEA